MANPLLNSSFFGGPTNGAPAQNGSTNLFSGLLEQARTLGNGAENQQNGYGFLPDVRPTLPDIERQSESVIGRGKGRVVRSGEGHSLLNRHGINTLNTQDRISQLAGSQAGPSGLADSGSAAPPRRRRRVHDAIGAQNIDVAQAYQGDIPSWSRNWHETVILQGIETQRKNTVKAFNKQFQTRMANNWEEEKKKVLQNELGVAQDEAGNASGLGRSTLGQTQRRFPLAQSTTKSAESAQGGLVMHSREHKYANTIEKINKDRLNRRDPQVSSILLEAAQGSQQSEIASALSLISSMVHESGATADRPPVHERQYAHDYLADARSIEKRRLNEKLAEGARSRLEEDYRDHMNKQNAANARIAAIGGQPGVLEKVRGYSAIQLHQRDAEARYHTEKIDGAPLYMHVWYLLRSGYSAEAVDLLAHNQNRLKREDAALPGALKAYYAAPDRRLGRGQRDQLMNDYNNHIRNNHSVDVFKAALYKLIGRFDLGKKGFKGAVDTTEDWIWGNLMLIRESGNSEDGTAEKYDYADFGRIVQDTGSAHFDGGGAKWYVWLTALLCAGEFESAIAYLHSKPEYRTDAVHLGIALAYYGLLRIADSPEDPLCFMRDVGFSRSSSLNFYRMISIYITPFFSSAPEAALQYAYLIALNGDVPLQGEQQKQLALNMVRDIVVSSRQFGKLLGTVRPDGVKVPGAIERDINLLGLRDSQAHIRSVILSAAEQSNIDASLTDSIELYHLAGAPDKVIDAVTRALAQSISVHGASRTGQLQQRLDLRGAFGGVESIEDLAARVIGVYENGIAARQAIGPKKWEALGTLVRLKRAMAQYDGDRPDLALDTFKQSEVIPLDTIDPSTIARYTARFIALLDNSAVADLDEVVITTMKCIHKLSSQLQNSPYGDAGRQQQLQRLKESAMAVMQFASGLRLRLGADVYRQLSSISAFL